MNPEQNYSPAEIGLGRLVSFDKGDFVGRLALEREAAAGGPPGVSSGCSSTGTTSRPCTTPRTAAGHQPERRPRPGPGLRGRSPGRPGDQPRLEPDPQAGDRARVGAPSLRGGRTPLTVEWTVEARRGRVGATVVELPFLDLERKRT